MQRRRFPTFVLPSVINTLLPATYTSHTTHKHFQRAYEPTGSRYAVLPLLIKSASKVKFPYSLLLTPYCYSSLITPHSSLSPHCLLTSYFLLLTPYSFLLNSYFLVLFSYLLLRTSYFVLRERPLVRRWEFACIFWTGTRGSELPPFQGSASVLWSGATAYLLPTRHSPPRSYHIISYSYPILFDLSYLILPYLSVYQE